MKYLTILLIVGILLLNSGCTQVVQTNSFRIGSSWEIPPAFNGNPWSLSGTCGFMHFIYDPLFTYVPVTGKFIPAMAESLVESDEGRKFTLTIRQQVKWHSGAACTAEDVKTTHLLAWLHNLIPTLEKIDILDDHTLVYTMKYPLKPMERINFLTQPLNSPACLYGAFAEKVPELVAKGLKFVDPDRKTPLNEEELEDRNQLEKARTKVRERLYKFRPEFHLGTGPFKMKVITSSDAVLDKFDQYWNACNVFVDKVSLIRWPSNEVMWASLIAGNIDASHPATPFDVAERILKLNSRMKIVTVSDLKEFGLLLNFRRKPVNDLNFRKAIAHIIDKDQIRKNSYYYSLTSGPYNQGIIESLKNRWLTTEFYQSRLTCYEQNVQKAADILNQAGYKKNQEGFYLDLDQQLIQLEIACQAGANDWILGAEIAANQLKKAGIKTNVRTMEPSIYNSLLLKGEFDLATWMTVDMSKYVYPSTTYDIMYGKSGFIKQVVRFPDVVSGMDGENENTVLLASKLVNSNDESERKAIIEKLAWISNSYLPAINIYEKKLMVFIQEGQHVQNWPPQDDPGWSLATMGIEQLYSVFIRTGLLRGCVK